ncbi:AAA family ATPase [Actinoplanes nipponensis]|uniref:AAA family ATPase n=1 Tax=Actinoplanes nipponensis TaxID=135950 RepID=UPI001EF391CD|nr:AAA family ATPase [Actinoplanes nipponensis]
MAGPSGSGKTTTAQRIAAILRVPRVEIDSLFHGPGWTPRPSFVTDVHRFAAGPAWVTEWQYSAVREHLADRADLLVWLDLPRWLVMRQVIARTVRRRLRREELWHGNTEAPLWTILTTKDHIVRWAWQTHPTARARVRDQLAKRPELTVVRLRSRREIARWLRGPLRQALR